MSDGHEHCEHFRDWPMAEGQTERSGDPGDGLGVQGVWADVDSQPTTVA